ncbi:uncharacterized protein [Typha angustifolia]|uniref:uncharacterized protein isoform X1 n=1 Tax=Typha angustifolia TaxID=59011 RepID=UPI003C2BC687
MEGKVETTMHQDSRKEKVFKLFGVRITKESGDGAASPEKEEEEVMRKSKSMGNLIAAGAAAPVGDGDAGDEGYHSEGGLVRSSKRRAQERKKAVPWTEEEHRTFLAGLEKLGKGDWRGIAKEFVTTRTPTQVASHAQKYFLRQSNTNKKKRRSSLFDAVVSHSVPTSETLVTPLSSMRVHEVTNITNELLRGSSLDGPLFSNAIKVTPQTTEAFPASLVIKEQPGVEPNMQSVNYLVSFSKTSMEQVILNSSFSSAVNIPDEAPPTFQVDSTTDAANFLRLSSNSSVQLNLQCPSQFIAASHLTENSELELTIAPPPQHNLTKVSSESYIGAVRVI